MTKLRIALYRLWGLFHRGKMEHDLDREQDFHLQMEIDENLRGGMTRDAARSAAMRRFGGVARTKERYREAHTLPAIEMLVQDLRYGLHMLCRNPGFTAVAVLSLALGIGANCAVFTLMNTILLKELPVKDPGQLAAVTVFRNNSPRDLSYPAFREISSRQQSFTELAASGSFDLTYVNLEGGGELQELGQIQGGIVSSNYFSMLGVQSAAGRLFTAQDSATPGQNAETVIGYGFWERKFASDPLVLGKTLYLNRIPFTIVGVAPRGFFGDVVGLARDIWIPILMQPSFGGTNMLERRSATWFRSIGRLKPGVAGKQANAELTGLYQQWLSEDVAGGTGTLDQNNLPIQYRIEVQRGSSGLNRLRARLERPLQLLMAVVGLVLLIACCNVANLLLARGAARQREIGIRLAIGSSRRRILRQLLTESVLLAAIGGAAGFATAYGSSSLLVGSISGGMLPQILDLHPDFRVFAFTLAVSVACSVVFGLVPALQATSVDLDPVLRASSQNQSTSRRRQRIGQSLVVVQVALSLWLLIGAGLAVRSLQNLNQLDIGMDRSHVLMLRVGVERSVQRSQLPEIRDRLAERLKTLPGVQSVSFSQVPLFSGSMNTSPVRVPGSKVDPEHDPDVMRNWVSSDYFQTLGIGLRLGRSFTERDNHAGPKVAILNEATARRYFGQENPIGRIIYFPQLDGQGRYIPFQRQLDPEQGVQIVGVVQDTRYNNLREDALTVVYFPIAQAGGFGQSVEIRTANDPQALESQLPRVLREVNRGLAIGSMQSIEEQIDTTLSLERLAARLLGFFGILALVLAGVGLYGVMSYAVARRTGEIGIRIAMGAGRAAVISMIVRQTLLLVTAGVALGVPAALASTHLLTTLLFGLKATDPATIVSTTALLLTIAALAGYIPARRASRVDPMIALRHE